MSVRKISSRFESSQPPAKCLVEGDVIYWQFAAFTGLWTRNPIMINTSFLGEMEGGKIGTVSSGAKTGLTSQWLLDEIRYRRDCFLGERSIWQVPGRDIFFFIDIVQANNVRSERYEGACQSALGVKNLRLQAEYEMNYLTMPHEIRKWTEVEIFNFSCTSFRDYWNEVGPEPLQTMLDVILPPGSSPTINQINTRRTFNTGCGFMALRSFGEMVESCFDSSS